MNSLCLTRSMSFITRALKIRKQTPSRKPRYRRRRREWLLSAWRGPGRLHRVTHFVKRAKERNFTILDVEYVIKYGSVVSGPTFCGEPHNNHEYYFRAEVDGIMLKVAFALDATQDYEAGPLVVLLTAVWNTPSGCRNK